MRLNPSGMAVFAVFLATGFLYNGAAGVAWAVIAYVSTLALIFAVARLLR